MHLDQQVPLVPPDRKGYPELPVPLVLPVRKGYLVLPVLLAPPAHRVLQVPQDPLARNPELLLLKRYGLLVVHRPLQTEVPFLLITFVK